MTEALFEKDGKIKLFSAKVVWCEKEKNLFKIILDKTAFFPEGGGQKGDVGYILKGEKAENDFYITNDGVTSLCKKVINVTDTQEKNGEIIHFCSSPIDEGTTVTGLLNYDVRFRRMQNHTGEHIVSGLIHKHFGYDNVGFHMGSDEVTLDVNGPLSSEQVFFIEKLANFAVAENVPVTAEKFSGDILKTLDYRSKLDLVENVRLVTVEGYDVCACCAPHVSRTGEIGIIKLLGFMNYKQGTRIRMLCGFDALDDYNEKMAQVSASCAMLSSKQGELSENVNRVLEENKKEKQEKNILKNKIADLLLEKAKEEGKNCLFTDINDPVFMRYLATNGSEVFGICGVFCMVSEGSYRYVVVGKNCDMRQFAKGMNASLCGRGGGDTELIQGSVKSPASSIEEFFAK